ncbi:phosphocarrier protein Chr [Virgibacillus dokdonensis]|uniref:HPr-like protein Crh n=2 Tax=Virgibacillus TaxID=84406 RepID=A0A2K9IV50_9BACI|nr:MULTISPECIES: HPr family phosphocarrier protein [Virgibacillus]AUJ23244.1 HPr-like protein Crh [Virgibacillus dokdonensis]NWO15128.1 HPr family phosphocarrier protein [Virgibacillus sp.]RFA33001.1 phosphocarrier protein Chr [Virgibacillus dokdonensis]SHH35807.1 catabolite repression HPr-like protein [Virgibacillus chiguensis]
MVERIIKVNLSTGLQARPAAEFVQEANRFHAHVFIEKNGKKVNAKSIMGLMSIAIVAGEEITLIADGTDEEQAIERLTKFVSET